jgi:hypothetical protein
MDTILIIEPDPLLREAIGLTLSGRYTLIPFKSIREAMSAVPSPVSAIVLGTVTSHAEFLKLRFRFGLIPFVLLPGLEEYQLSCLESSVHSPLSRAGLIGKIESMLDRKGRPEWPPQLVAA